MPAPFDSQQKAGDPKPKAPADFDFPVKGLDENWAYKAQPEGTTPSCLNVRPYDVLGQRLRGGQRAGLSKYFPAQPNGNHPIQMMVQEPVPAGSYIETFSYNNGTIFDGVGAPWLVYGPNSAGIWYGDPGGMPYLSITAAPWITGHSYTTHDQVFEGGNLYCCIAAHTSTTFATDLAADFWAIMAPAWVTATPYAVGQLVLDASKLYVCLIAHTSGVFATDLAASKWAISQPPAWVGPGTAYVVGSQVSVASIPGVGFVCTTANTSSASFNADLVANYWTAYFPLPDPSVIENNAYIIQLPTPGNESFYVYSLPLSSGDMTVSFTVTDSATAYNSTTQISLLLRVGPSSGYLVSYLTGSPISPPGFNVFDYQGNYLGYVGVTGFPQPWATSGAAPGQVTQNTPVQVTVTLIGSNMYFYLNGLLVGQLLGVFGGSGLSAGFQVFANAGNPVQINNWSAGIVAPSAVFGNRILVCSGGALATGSGGGAWTPLGSLMNTTGIVRGVPLNGKIYLLDGTSSHYLIYDPGTRTVLPWTPDDGVLPVGTSNPSHACSIAARYRNRIVLAGLDTDPQDWFMSAVGDPLNWDYSPATITTTIAVAGNNSDAGLVGDSITCLAAYNDDLLIMGGSQSIWLMRGDPADGGRIDAISHEVGIIGPDAWCLDAQGNMYFFGGGVFYRMGPVGASTMYQKTLGGMPEPLSRGRLDSVFNKVDASNSTVRLLWDETLHGVHIYITPTISGVATHYWWDARTDGFWPEQYPNFVGPTSAMVFKSPTSTARADLLGGQDGYIRQVDYTSKTDDGISIPSYVDWGPQNSGSVHQNSRINRVTVILDQASDPVTVSVFAAQSPQEVVQSSAPAFSFQASPVNRYAIPRINGNSLLVGISNITFVNSWTTTTVYTVGTTVVGPDNHPYICAVAHTSGVFATDLAAGDWSLSDFRTWSLETISVVKTLAGRTRHGRL